MKRGKVLCYHGKVGRYRAADGQSTYDCLLYTSGEIGVDTAIKLAKHENVETNIALSILGITFMSLAAMLFGGIFGAIIGSFISPYPVSYTHLTKKWIQAMRPVSIILYVYITEII